MGSETKVPTRKLSLLERFMLAGRNAGHPHPVTLLLTYPSRAHLPTSDFLLQRVKQLQHSLPLLHAHVVDARALSPHFASNAEIWKGEDVLRHEEFEGGLQAGRDRILYEELNRMTGEDPETRPFWQVTIFTSRSSDIAYLAFSTDHMITDGMGTLNLLHALLDPAPHGIPIRQLQDIPLLEDTISLRPRLRMLLPEAMQELIVPKLPPFLRHRMTAKPPWPGDAIRSPLLKCPFAQSVYDLDPNSVDVLKAVGKAHGVPTLHPILKFAYLAALWAVYGDSTPELNFFACSPRNERDLSLGHCKYTGTYTSNLGYRIWLSGRSDFWAETRRFSAFLRSPAGLKASRGGMGLLDYLPKKPRSSAKGDPRRPTGWEDYCLTKTLTAKYPCRESLNISNLGYTHLPPGATDLVFNQMQVPFELAVQVSIIGSEAGVRMASGWMEGGAVRNEEIVDVEKVLGRVIGTLVGDGKGELSLAKLVA